jgi:hypothetical protein
MMTACNSFQKPELEVKWQNLSRTDYQVTSPKSQEYNCFAWAAEENDRWWQPIPGEQFYWPEGVPQEETDEVNGKTVTLLRRSLNSVPEITNAGRVLRISVPTDGSNLAIQMLPSR